jgi:hypothetical protein
MDASDCSAACASAIVTRKQRRDKQTNKGINRQTNKRRILGAAMRLDRRYGVHAG